MVTQIGSALAAYAKTAAGSASSGQENAAMGAPSGPSFMDMLKDAALESRDIQQNAEQMSAKAMVGKADLVDVVQAVSNAEVTLQTVVAVRDKVLQAYQEIMRMPI
jgi:flagellar hook-basal body complex protein FliE